jgi:hypothetical protein
MASQFTPEGAILGIVLRSYNNLLPGAISIISNNVSFKARAIVVRSDNDFSETRVITKRSNNFCPQC